MGWGGSAWYAGRMGSRTRRRSRWVGPAALLILLPLLLAACGSGSGPGSTGDPGGSAGGPSSSSPSLSGPSGVTGRTVVAPTCPVEQTASPCPPRPIRATVEARRPDSPEIVAHTQSSHDGSFRLVLAPGTYVLTVKPPGPALMPRPKQLTVTVSPHEFAQVTVHLDSGIRGDPVTGSSRLKQRSPQPQSDQRRHRRPPPHRHTAATTATPPNSQAM